MTKVTNKSEQINGQLKFDFSLDTSNYVVQSNQLIGGRQALSLNAAKIVRAAIMQVVRDDEDLKPYVISISELAKLLKIPASNLYRDVDLITDDIMKNPVEIRSEVGSVKRFMKIPWVQRCEYNSYAGLMIQLNEDLRPLLLNLQKKYTQYPFENILSMKSVYAVRIYELIVSRIYTNHIPDQGVHVVITVEDIRESCDCDDKYPAFGSLKNKVLDTAVKQIVEYTSLHVEFTYKKKERSVVAIDFYVNSKINMRVRKDLFDI